MSPVFFCLLTKNMTRLQQFIELGLKTQQINYLIETRCNNIPLAYYCLMKMELLMIQANQMQIGEDDTEEVNRAVVQYKHQEGEKKSLMKKKERDKFSIAQLASDLEIL